MMTALDFDKQVNQLQRLLDDAEYAKKMARLAQSRELCGRAATVIRELHTAYAALPSPSDELGLTKHQRRLGKLNRCVMRQERLAEVLARAGQS